MGCNLSFTRSLKASYLVSRPSTLLTVFLMGRLGYPNKGRNLGDCVCVCVWGGALCKPKSFLFCWISPPPKSRVPPFVPWLHTTYCKNVSDSFRKILSKIFPLAYIFNHTIMANLKKLIGTKSFNTKQCPAGLSHRIVRHYPLELLWKTLGYEEVSQPTRNKLVTFLTRKIVFNKFKCSAIKNVITFLSHSNFHLMALFKHHL